MKLKSALKYQLSDVAKMLAIFYAIIYGINIILAVYSKYNSNKISINNMEISSVAIIVTFPLSFFLTHLKMFLQNGVSRKTFLKSMGISIFVVSLSLGIIDTLTHFIFSHFIKHYSLFFSLYSGRFPSHLSFVISSLWNMLLYAALAFSALFLRAIIYHLTKVQRYVISALIVCLLFLAPVRKSITMLFLWIMQVTNRFALYPSMIFFLIISMIFALLSILVVRRIEIKK